MPSKQITLEAIEQIRRLSPKRRRLSDSSDICRLEDGTCFVSLRFPSLVRLFRSDTQIGLNSGPYSQYIKLGDKKEIDVTLKWLDKYKRSIFLRDMLDCSVALDYNFAERGRYTDLGLAEYNAKNARHRVSVETLARACIRAISDISLYRESDVICAVPPSPDKEWDLPTEIVRLVSEKTDKPNISALVQFGAPKKSIKVTSLAQKWATLEAAELSVNTNLTGSRVILIDDKYQSGTTEQFVASRLYGADADEVNGLFCVKTWRDTDNQ